jgi:phage baseplate assembly protein W
MDTTFKTYIAEMINTEILYYEARIDLQSVVVDDSNQNNGVILIALNYTVRTTNSRYNYVYPYYLNEGSNL